MPTFNLDVIGLMIFRKLENSLNWSRYLFPLVNGAIYSSPFSLLFSWMFVRWWARENILWMFVQNDGTEIWVQIFWYRDTGAQDLGTKKTESLSGGASQKSASGRRVPPGGLEGRKPPKNSRRSGGRQPPSKNNFVIWFYGETHTPPLGQGFRTAWLVTG